ncbi:MAG: hypothetical protein ACRCYO_11305 [Bacteroidia bacterium]
MMKLFPTSTYSYRIFGDEAETLDRLIRRTETTSRMVSQLTDKSFCGIVMNRKFKLISSEIGIGAFCVLTGEIEGKDGRVFIEINKPFRIMLCVLMLMLFLSIALEFISHRENFSIVLILFAIFLVLIIRFVLIEYLFKRLSKRSLRRLSDILDMEDIKAA